MNRKSKCFATVLIVLSIFVCIPQWVIAEEVTKKDTTEIQYSVDEHYEWAIPKSINLSDTQNMTVQISNTTIRSNGMVTVRMSSQNEFQLINMVNQSIPYVVCNAARTVLANNSIVASVTGPLSGTLNSILSFSLVDDAVKHSGRYSDKLTFTAQIESIN